MAVVLFYLPPSAAITFFGFFLLVGGAEWSGFFAQGKPLLRFAYAAGLAILAAAVIGGVRAALNLDWVLLAAVCCWVGIAAWLIARQTVSSSAACALFGYVGLIPAWYAVLRLFQSPEGPWLLVWVVAIVAAADIGAYFVGRSWGQTKLAPRISPGKTREGLLGGVVCAALAGALGAWLIGLSPLALGLAGVCIALISVVGDLTVSACKRNAGLKDSGWILPGHGGVMDRIDSLIAALPLFVLVLAGFGELPALTTFGA